MNAQPMGFYPPSSLVRDAQRRGVEVRAPHINRSEAQCDIEDGQAVRVGLAYVQSVGEEEAKSVVAQQPYRDLGDLARRAPVKQDVLEALVSAGACDEWGPRRELLWRLGVTPRGETVAGGNRQLALPLEPTAEIPELPEQTPVGADARRLQAHLALGRRPSAAAAAPVPACRSPDERRPRRHSERHAHPGGRHGDRAAAPGDREGHRLHAARGRARPGEPDHPARRSTRSNARSSGASR